MEAKESSLSQADEALEPLELVLPEDANGRFQIICLLGSGATASVYKARHILLDSLVAIKIMHSHRVRDEENLRRFDLEIKSLSQVDHPRIAKVYGSGKSKDGRPFLIMEYVEGKTLATIISEDGALPEDRARNLFIQIADAMQTVHQLGILHRDLKPSNVLLCKDDAGEESCKIIDFGLVRLTGTESQGITKTGAVMGSAAYMSPEQCQNKELSERSDIYSLGCLMYNALCGAPPFTDENVLLLMSKQTSTVVDQVPVEGIDAGLESIILSALEKNPENRPASMQELRTLLHKSQTGELNFKAKKKQNQINPNPNRRHLVILSIVATTIAGISVAPYLRGKTVSPKTVLDANPKASESKSTPATDLLISKTPTQRITILKDWLTNPKLSREQRAAIYLSIAESILQRDSKKESTEYSDYMRKAEMIYEDLSKESTAAFIQYADKLAILKNAQGKPKFEQNLREKIYAKLKVTSGKNSDATLAAGQRLIHVYRKRKNDKGEMDLLKELIEARPNDSFHSVTEARNLAEMARLEYKQNAKTNIATHQYAKRFTTYITAQAKSDELQLVQDAADDLLKCEETALSIELVEWLLQRPQIHDKPKLLSDSLRLAAKAYYTKKDFATSQAYLEKSINVPGAKNSPETIWNSYVLSCTILCEMEQWQQIYEKLLPKMKEIAEKNKPENPGLLLEYYLVKLRTTSLENSRSRREINKPDADIKNAIAYINSVPNLVSADFAENFIRPEAVLAEQVHAGRKSTESTLIFEDMLRRIDNSDDKWGRFARESLDIYRKCLTHDGEKEKLADLERKYLPEKYSAESTNPSN